MTKKINILKDESGAVLVIALIMMVVMTLIGIAGSFTSIFEIMISGHKRGSTNAFYSADSGVQVTVASIDNFDLPGKYNNNQYIPPIDPKLTNAKITINHVSNQVGAPRGSGFSATGNFEFVHYVIESTGTDQIDTGATRSTCMIEQKVVRLIPTLQGGN
ncbi:MAG: pilus assembly PilX N-terminal domain-containing protein [Deltaproteobacteria bacterium]|nr:pilus assembly PilX N-terminal domain-containing protein [Deltaproteobacteria bacterium]